MGYGLQGSSGNTSNMANNILLVQVDVDILQNPLQHLPQGVGVRAHRGLGRPYALCPVAFCLPPPRALSLKACFRNLLRLSTMSLENIGMAQGHMSSNGLTVCIVLKKKIR